MERGAMIIHASPFFSSQKKKKKIIIPLKNLNEVTLYIILSLCLASNRFGAISFSPLHCNL